MKNLKNNHIKTILYIALFLTFSQFILAQNNQLDSLFNCLKLAKEDTLKAQLFLKIGNLFEKNSTDSAIYFYHQAIKYAENQSSDENCQRLNASSYRNLGAVYLRYKGQNDSAIYFTERALTIFSKLTNSKNKKLATIAKDETSSCYTNLGIIQKNNGSYDKAIEFYIKSLKIDKETDNKKGMASDYNNIGNIHYYQKNFDKAVKYYIESSKLREIIDDKDGMISCNVNIGNIYFKQQKYTLAQFFYQKALILSKIIGNKRGAAQCSMNIATVIGKIGNYNLALDSFISSLKIYEELEDKYNICLNWCNIASMNVIIADSSNISKKEKLSRYNEAIKYGLKSYNLAKELKALPLIKYSADELIKSYKGTNNPDKALEFAQISIATNDSMFLEEKTKAIAEMEGKYQNEKKQKEIELLEKDKVLQTEEIAKQTLLRNSFIIGFFLILLIAFIFYSSYRNKKKSNILMTNKNVEIQTQKEEILTQKYEIESQRDTVLEVNKVLNAMNKQITDSINYAKLIQMAILPSISEIQNSFPESFIFFQPKDIVSGDFYWFSKQDKKYFIALVDCTGHGVPGAFMSMIGNTLLNQIVNEKQIYNPSEIMLNLHKGILFALSQRNDSNQEDGMEVSLCIIDEKKIILCSTRQSSYMIIDDKLIENEGNHVSVGSKKREVTIADFKTEEYSIEKNMTLYLASDGYYDQFGGEKNKKFGSARFIELLQKINMLNANEQKDKIEKNFFDWKANNKQIDDVTVIGIKI